MNRPPEDVESPDSPDSMDALLVAVINENREKAIGWLKDEPGSWGFLAGKAVRACREQKGAPLTDPERRLVWHRLWQILTQLKEHTAR